MMGVLHDSQIAIYGGNRIEIAARVDNLWTGRSQYNLLINHDLADNLSVGFWGQFASCLWMKRFVLRGSLALPRFDIPPDTERREGMNSSSEGVSRTVGRKSSHITPPANVVGTEDDERREKVPVVVWITQTIFGTRYELEIDGEPWPLRLLV